ncbi:MAG: type II toxin-antitoxin system HicA family toxin [Oscillospiraceae bacterium]|nr:type II toxin-antitoxin system HicA family toxin [Oscillospiraceae bacterium]
MKFKEIEGIILDDGWFLKNIKGSHYQYIHHFKIGKVTIPYHGRDLHIDTVKSILKQAGIK